jgi:integrase
MRTISREKVRTAHPTNSWINLAESITNMPNAAVVATLQRWPSLLTGLVALEIDLNGETRWLLTTQLSLARRHLAEFGERIESEGGHFSETADPATGDPIPESIETKLTRARMVAKEVGINIDDVRIQNLRIHDLRRTPGRWLAKTGASMVIIGKSLNHKSQQTTAIYARPDLDPVRQSVNTATAAMLDAAGIKRHPPSPSAE